VLAEPTTPTSPAPSAGLCLECGLCCDGTLFTWVPLEEDERRRVALPLVDESAQLALPCGHLRSGACAVYDERPVVCARYRCSLLGRVERGDVSSMDARAVVRRTRSLVLALEGELDDGRASVWNRVERVDPEGSMRLRADASSPRWARLARELTEALTADFAVPWIAVAPEPT
jgi:hypothetical protein